MSAKQSKGAELLSSLHNGLKNRETVGWPGGDFEVEMRPLSDHQLQECKSRAIKRFEKLNIELTLMTIPAYDIEEHIQALAIAIYDPGTDNLLFADVDDFRKNIEPEERESLIGDYQSLQKRSNPDSLPTEQLDEIKELIKKKDPQKLNSLGSKTLTSFLLSMADQLLTSPASSSSSSKSGNGALTDDAQH